MCTLVPVPLSAPYLEPNSFYGILVGHIYRLLRERERVNKNCNWVLEEAMNMRAGTFRNALAKKLENVIIPILAEIFAFLDHNSNLSLLHAQDATTPHCELWLKIFQSCLVEEHLSYERVFRAQKVIVLKEEFDSKFPFFWLVKAAVDIQWDNAKGITGNLPPYHIPLFCCTSFYPLSNMPNFVISHGLWFILQVPTDSNSTRNWDHL